jgi:hypothetical protein
MSLYSNNIFKVYPELHVNASMYIFLSGERFPDFTRFSKESITPRRSKTKQTSPNTYI